MATNDKNEGPKIGQVVLFQIPSTHVICPAIIILVNSDGTVNLASFEAGNALTSRTSIGYLPGFDRTAASDSKWSYMDFF